MPPSPSACLEYEGSLTVDEDLLEAAGILPYEAIICSNLNNGERFMTYAMAGKRGSGEIVLNGPTARKARCRRSDHHFLLRVLRRGRDQTTRAQDHSGQRQESDHRSRNQTVMALHKLTLCDCRKIHGRRSDGVGYRARLCTSIGQVEPKVKAYVTQIKDAALQARALNSTRG